MGQLGGLRLGPKASWPRGQLGRLRKKKREGSRRLLGFMRFWAARKNGNWFGILGCRFEFWIKGIFNFG
jgi:hypothetical protein